MNKNNIYILITASVSLFFMFGCGVCDPRPSDRLSFFITKNNKDLFIDTLYDINSLKLFDQNNNIDYQLPLEIDSSFNFSDSVIVFSTEQVYNYFNKNGNYKYLLELNSTESINITLQITKNKVRKCGIHYTIDKVYYDDKVSVLNNNIFA